MSILLEQAAEVLRLFESASSIDHPDARLSSALELAHRLSSIGRWSEARSLGDAILSKCGNREILFLAAVIIADSEVGVGEYDSAALRLERLLREIESLEAAFVSRHLPRLETKLAFALIRLNRISEAEPLLLSAYAQLVKKPDSSDLGWCACNLGNLAVAVGDLRGGISRFNEALVSAVRTQTLNLKGAALRNLGLAYRQRCRWDMALESFRNAAAAWKELGHVVNWRLAEHGAAIILWKKGRLTEVSQVCDANLQAQVEQHLPELETWALSLRGLSRIHLGEFQEGTADLKVAMSHNPMPDYSRPSVLLGEFLGDVHLEQGQAAEALKHYDEVWPKAMALVPKGDIVAELRRRRAECYLLLGRNDEAYAAAKEGLDHCRELGDRYEEAATYRVLALSAAAVGRHEEARQHFTQGFAYYDDIETPYEWGKLWMAYGDWLLGSGAGPHEDRSAAREAYLAARDYFSNMGARAKLREAEARLKTLDAEMPATIATTHGEADATGPTSIIRRPQRRPASQTEIDRRSEGAWHDWYIITRHEPLLNILDRAAKLARSDVPILVTGETGTGKELVASGIHRASRVEGTYIPLNCAAVPKEMIESELFGHVRGAFSGAIAERQGLVEMAAKGTLFLDEVGEMSEAMQAKLLRFLESGEYRRVGEGAHRLARTRLVAATNVSRERLEKGEGFRHDLFWRLAQGCLEVPALRHRLGDVPILVEHFLRLESRKMNKLSLTISDAARAELAAYAWPGNVRELVGVMRRAVALAEHTIEPEHLDLTSTREVAVTLTEEMAAAERMKLARAMKEHGDSPTAAARALGIPRTTLLMKLKRYGMR